jgi:signal transduction histidine kinase
MAVQKNDPVPSFAKWLQRENARLDRLYQGILRRNGYDPLSVAALSRMSIGSAAGMLASGRRLEDFLEQVEYNGRRLAKLQISPDRAAATLLEYHRLIAPLLRSLAPSVAARMRAAAEQLHFRTCIVLNDAAYQVREAEAQTLLDLSQDELAARSPRDLLERYLTTLARYCRAGAARLYLAGAGDPGGWVLQAATDGLPQGSFRVTAARAGRLSSFLDFSPDDANECLIEPDWAQGSGSVWSLPLPGAAVPRGVVQFRFKKVYGSLPRERELLKAAAQRCVLSLDKLRLTENLAQSEEQVRRLARRMIQVEEAERRRISRDLHDEAGQSLLCIRLRLEILEAAAEAARDPGLHTGIAETRQLTERAILETRRLIAALSPSLLSQMGLEAALRQLVQRFRDVFPGRVRLRSGRLGRLRQEVEITVYRVVQECCNNIARHSQATAVNLSVELADESVRVIVEDNGVGFDTNEAFHRGGSFGLAGMRERVMLLGGQFSIDSRRPGTRRKAGQGTTLRISVPVSEESVPALTIVTEGPRSNMPEGKSHVEDSNCACG